MCVSLLLIRRHSFRLCGITQPVDEQWVVRSRLAAELHPRYPSACALIAPARQTRADCSNWYAEDCRDLIVAHAFKTHEQDGLPLLLRKLIDSSSEVAQLKYGMCVRCHSE